MFFMAKVKPDPEICLLVGFLVMSMDKLIGCIVTGLATNLVQLHWKRVSLIFSIEASSTYFC